MQRVKQNWKKEGLIIVPSDEYHWMSSHTGPSFIEKLDDTTLRVYITGRDKENVSRIGFIDLNSKDLKTIKYISKEPLLDVGNIGCFDERGVSYPWIVEKENGEKLMYYVGWVAGGISRFQNFTGLARSLDNGKTYSRVKKVPILDRSDAEPIGSGSVAVLKEDIWKIWYTSFVKWEEIDGKIYHFYHIKYAESDDGINWKREQKVAIDFNDKKENTIGKPMVIKENDRYIMYYSYRKMDSSYRIGYAESHDGINWERMDDCLGLDVSENAWDSEMIEYAYVFDLDGKRHMIYNGNSFGKTGLGLATLN
jgi:predicted GH43/DUF377 family glycosyl hydrolase